MKQPLKEVIEYILINPNREQKKGFFQGATPEEMEKIKTDGVTYNTPKPYDDGKMEE